MLLVPAHLRAGISAAGGSSFTPLLLVNFDGLSNGQSVSAATGGSVAGKRFSSWGTYADGFGSRAVTGLAYPGHSSSAELSIESGSDGNEIPGGTGNNGEFGGNVGSSIFPEVHEGEEIWIGTLLYVPTGFNWTTDIVPGLKGIRLGQPGTTAKIEHHFGRSGGVNTGINLLSEIQPVSDAFGVHALDRVVISGQWNWVEIYVKASATAANCVRRAWINDEMVIERVAGVNTKYHAAGSWQTQTHSVSERILTDSSNFLNSMMLFTYWNGGAPQNQALNTQKIVIHKTVADLSATDEFGNKMIGSAFGIAA